MDTRRRWLDWALAAAVAMGLGNGGGAVGLPAFAPELLDFEKSSAKEAPGVIEARRWWAEREGRGGELARSADMVTIWKPKNECEQRER